MPAERETTEQASVTPTATTTPPPTSAPEQPTATVAPSPTNTPSPTATPDYCPDNTGTTGATGTGTLRVFFISEGDIQVWDEEGGEVTTIAANNVYRLTLSPDGKTLAFLRHEGTNVPVWQRQMALWAIDSDGANERPLISGEAFRALGAAEKLGDYDVLAWNSSQFDWIPNTNRLAFRLAPIIEALGATPQPEIRVVDVLNGEQTVLLTTPEAFSFSPDGEWMTLADDTGIDLLKLDGSRLVEDVVTYPHIGLGHQAYQAQVAWDPDGGSFSVALPSADPFSSAATLTVWRVVVDDATASQFATFNGFPLPTFGLFGSAIFSPDRSQIAFYRSLENNHGELLIADVAGAWRTVYDSGRSIRFLGWSPGGDRFAYAFDNSAGRPLRIGRLCTPSLVLDGPSLVVDTAVTWVSSTQFLYVGHPNSPTLFLGSVDGSVTTLGPLSPFEGVAAHRYAFLR